MNYKKKYKEFRDAVNRAEQHMFPFILMIEGMIEKQYKDLQSNYRNV